MPTVAWILGYAVVFFVDDHGEPHFHLLGKGVNAKFLLSDLSIIDMKGNLTPREIRLVRDWARRHLPALYRNWDRVRGQLPIEKIKD
ncbi:MAG: hypothetical protein RLY86_422 [Pseudomonadota bacterium]|jgi:hypothetical protein